MMISVCMAFSLLISNSATDYKNIQREREKAQRAFEDAENNAEEQNEVIEDVHEVPVQKIKYKSPIADSVKEIPLEEADSAPASTPEAASKISAGKAGYWTKLKNALPCFKAFLSAMYRARFQRDTTMVACSNQGSQACGNSAQHELEKDSVTLVDQFNVCIQQEN